MSTLPHDQAMILAAGQGKRMRPLTNSTPKALLTVGGKSLIQHHIDKLAQAGIKKIIINHAYLGNLITQALEGNQPVPIYLSAEGNTPLETAGGIIQALPLFDTQKPFVVVNVDIFTDFDFANLLVKPLTDIAHLVMVDNPAHNPQGDFFLESGQLQPPRENPAATRLTYSGVGLYHPQMFAGLETGKRALAPLLEQAIEAGHISGEHFKGQWIDIGTPERLAQANQLAIATGIYFILNDT